MKINNIRNNLTFGRVFAVAGKKKQIDELKNIIEKDRNYGMVLGVNYLFSKPERECICSKFLNKGYDAAFVIAGLNDIQKVEVLHPMFRSPDRISEFANDFIEIKDANKDSKIIIDAMA